MNAIQLRRRRILASASVLGLLLGSCTERGASGAAGPQQERAVPVEVGAVERGPLTDRRTVSGSLEASAEFVVAPKVGGRILALEVDLADPVERGQVVARLDDDEFVQAVQQAEADLAAARAVEAEARSAQTIAERALARLRSLREDGVASESQLDTVVSEEAASRSRLEVTRANVTRAESALETARIRLAYTAVTADWNGDDQFRVVAERSVDEGSNVGPNAALMTVVRLDPIEAVVYVAERDYRLLSVDQRAVLSTDAYPGRSFEGRVVRIAPVFRSATRQARVEIELPNPDSALKPGMFVRATLELSHVDEALSVPADAVTEREGKTGVLLVDADGAHVHWRPVELGIREGDRVEVLGADLSGAVVTLGQELCDDGARVVVIESPEPTAAR
ncbi:efflux RND transporter periplasmic adaptor subunit [Engelhardtia mirabilis]|uniref:Multidrug resistance protein MdtE n=1 Tax=Engelhardtia mirabilis TaxID=2528011 RepID=A0A518BMF2_9BACT|nr:Multidrug resistance protein MdtE precursor [Planctomycetes bacterium Pla133]QDV02485.1 Multidrug resistance protein MdtE precursor [Planctomycetes bacterium Pla86]